MEEEIKLYDWRYFNMFQIHWGSSIAKYINWIQL